MVVDNFLAEAENLIDLAINNAKYKVVADNFYPGMRKEAPNFYSQGMRDLMRKPLGKLGKLMFEAFQLDVNDLNCDSESFFSIVTVRPQDLEIQQTIPHADSVNPSALAFVHYLNGPEKGGTSFYKHRSTGFETANQSRTKEIISVLSSEFDRSKGPKEYINGSNDFFERIASYDSAFNRILIYRQTSLHAPNIGKDYVFSEDQKTFRITLNTFYD